MTPASPLPPPLEGESSKAYQAFASYCEMGETRTIEAVAAAYQKSVGLLNRWSRRHQWLERARQFDAANARAAALARQQQYVTDVQAHQQRYTVAGQRLYGAAVAMLDQLAAQQDGFTFTPATLGIIVKAFETARELEAHGLLIDKLMESLNESK